MSSITPEQAHYVLHNIFLPTLKTESRTTKKLLQAVPADKAAYQPDACAKSAMELLRHIAVADNLFLEAVINGVFNPANVKIPDDVTTPAAVAAWYEESYAKNFDTLIKLTGEQLSTYLRPMGSKVPAIYGESYDSAAAKKAASQS
jgi:uncharacterized damage-inducible protein DinB